MKPLIRYFYTGVYHAHPEFSRVDLTSDSPPRKKPRLSPAEGSEGGEILEIDE
jgi:hypothetical protein